VLNTCFALPWPAPAWCAIEVVFAVLVSTTASNLRYSHLSFPSQNSQPHKLLSQSPDIRVVLIFFFAETACPRQGWICNNWVCDEQFRIINIIADLKAELARVNASILDGKFMTSLCSHVERQWISLVL
jgi:hypothetical protein